MPVQQTPTQKMTDLRIQRALAKPGAIGMKGFLLWAEAAWPKAIVAPILQAASRYTPGAGAPVTMASPDAQGFGRFGRFGDVTVTDPNDPNNQISLSAGQTVGVDATGATVINNPDGSVFNVSTGVTSGGPTNAPVSAVTAATSSQPASSSWVADISAAVNAATSAFTNYQQVQDAQTLFNANLARAQQGKPPIGSNPTAYGLPSPTAQLGALSSGTGLMLVLGLVALLAIPALASNRSG